MNIVEVRSGLARRGLAIKTCSICRAQYSGWGGNAFPFEGRCCDECDRGVVIPARMLAIRARARQERLRKAGRGTAELGMA